MVNGPIHSASEITVPSSVDETDVLKTKGYVDAEVAGLKGYTDGRFDALGGGGGGGATLRKGVFSFVPAHSSFPIGASMTVRRPFIVPHTISRFRVHVRNRNQLTNTNLSGSFSAFAMYVGQAALDAAGAPNGNMTAAPTQIGGATTIASGATWTSDWVTPATFTIAKGKHHLLSFCGTHTASNWAMSTGVCWRSTSLADVSLQNMAGTVTYDTNNSFLDMFIEYEFTDDGAPIIFVVGNSLSGRSNSVWGGLDAWQHQWERAHKGVAANIAVAGAWTTNYGAADPKWDYYDVCDPALPLVPDAVIYLGHPSSDVAGGTAVATIKANMLASMNKGKAKFPTARQIISNLMPRTDGNTGTAETNRGLINTWLATLPGGADACIDLNSALIDWAASPPVQRAAYQVDGIHQSYLGNVQIAQAVPVVRRAN